MHQNYYFLRQLTPDLQQELAGAYIQTCFSQEKDELLLGFSRQLEAADFYIKAILTAQFSSLYFPESFSRARANSVNLFPKIIGEQVVAVIQHQNERSFYLELTNQKALLFKLFGNRANIVYFEQEVAKDLFHKKFVKDADLTLQGLHRTFSPDQADFLHHPVAPEKVYPTFGDLPGVYLKTFGYEQANAAQKWELIQQVKQELENPKAFYLIKLNLRTRLSLLPVGEIRAEFTKPMPALQEFVRTYLSEAAFENTYRTAYQSIARKIAGLNAYVSQTQAKLQALQNEASYAQTADVIMANLTNIPPRAELVVLFDFYQNQDRTFKLKPTETPQKFAERLYRKSKNQQIELQQLQERIKQKEEEQLALEIALQELTTLTDYKALKNFLKENTPALANPQKPDEEPFRVFTTESFKIMVGKSAKNNDVLTQQYTYKEGLWLHAKDVAGSHVIIKYQAGKTFPSSVIEKAAKLAAYYSKRKTDSLCPVLYTPKKFVRKAKGAAPGQVIVEREKVILVKPGNPFDMQSGK